MFNDVIHGMIQCTFNPWYGNNFSVNARRNSKDADLRKRRATEIHLIAAQKFLSEVAGLSGLNLDNGVCVTKLHAIDKCKHF